MKFLSIIVLVISLLTPYTLNAEPKTSITVGYYEFPPITYTDKTGQAQGCSINLYRQLLAETNYAVTFKNLPPARLYLQLISGEVDLWFGVPGKTELAEHVIESEMLISEANLALFYHPDAPPPVLPHDLTDKTVILINGYSYSPQAMAWLNDKQLNITTTRTRQHRSAIAMLLRRRGDYLLNYTEPMHYAQQQLNIDNLYLPYVPVQTIPGTFVVSKKSPHAPHLLDELEAAFLKLNRNMVNCFDRNTLTADELP